MDMQVGICVRTSFYYDRLGRGRLKAVHRRDTMNIWKAVEKKAVSSTNHESVLQLWMEKFTGSSEYFASTFKVVARGSDHEGCYFILVPVG